MWYEIFHVIICGHEFQNKPIHLIWHCFFLNVSSELSQLLVNSNRVYNWIFLRRFYKGQSFGGFHYLIRHVQTVCTVKPASNLKTEDALYLPRWVCGKLFALFNRVNDVLACIFKEDVICGTAMLTPPLVLHRPDGKMWVKEACTFIKSCCGV